MNRWLVILPLVVLGALIVFLSVKLSDMVGNGLAEDNSYKPAALIGKSIPETVLPILEGSVAGPRNVDLKTAGVGRPMIVNVFASWCAPCRIEHPELMALKARGVTIVGVAYKDEPEATAKFLEDMGNPFAMVLVDHEGRAGLDLGISGVPETFAVDAMGRITGKQSGPLLDDADIERLVASMQTAPRSPPTATERAR